MPQPQDPRSDQEPRSSRNPGSDGIECFDLMMQLIQTRKNKNKFILFQIRDTQLDQNNFKRLQSSKISKTSQKSREKVK